MYKIFLIFSFVLSFQAFSQEEKSDEVQPIKTIEEYTEDDIATIKEQRIKRIRRELIQIRSQIYRLQKSITDDTDMVVRIQQEAKINQLEDEYEKKKSLFIETITNINLRIDGTAKKKTTFSEDIKQILDPALNTFKQISKKPRQIQELNDEIGYVRGRYADAQKALKRLNDFIENNKDKKLNSKLKESKKDVEGIVADMKVRLEDLQFQVLKIEENEESIVTTFSAIIFEFIKTKGKNLILSFTVFLVVFWLFKLGQARFIKLILFRLNKEHRQDVYNWVVRPTKVIYGVVTTLVATFMSILTLYVLNDWVLVTIILITLAALVWSSKQYLPMFMEQSKIVLNLGSVREGERVVFNGLPWKIESLGFYCRLVNPALASASLRINTKELLHAHSRHCFDEEKWFPTNVGDWIQVGQGLQRVLFQSPEQVILQSIGGHKTFIPTVEFYKLNPTNYSDGYSIQMVFGVDYEHQKILFTEVIPNIKKELKEKIIQKIPSLKNTLELYEVDFKQAAGSSLDIRIFLQLKGEEASQKLRIERIVQAELVEICNTHNYTIPFNQMVVHMKDE